MKSYFAALSLMLLSSFNYSVAYADPIQTPSGRTPLNKVKMINNSGKDIGYIIISASDNPDNIYGIKAKNTDNYHAKATGDVNATIKIVPCKKINKVTGMCTDFNTKLVTNCVKEARYDFYKVRSVKILSSSSCAVICQDDDPASCLVN